QYALERLEAAGDTAAVRDRHLAYYVEFAEAAGRGMRTADEMVWSLRTVPEIENLRSALGWAIETRDVSHALRLVNALARQILWANEARFLAGIIEAVLKLDEVADHPLYPSALAVAGELARANGNYGRAVELAEEALRGADEADPARWLAE